MAVGGVALAAVFLVTTACYMGCRNVRSSKIFQPDVGRAIAALGTVAAERRLASAMTDVFVHPAALIHAPHLDLLRD